MSSALMFTSSLDKINLLIVIINDTKRNVIFLKQHLLSTKVVYNIYNDSLRLSKKLTHQVSVYLGRIFSNSCRISSVRTGWSEFDFALVFSFFVLLDAAAGHPRS